MPILTIELRGSSRGVVLSGRVLIGRWRGCGIPVGHQSVSRLHAWVDRQATGQYYIADADSRSGTAVNGQPIDGHYLLQDGDHIAIGPAKITYSLASALPKDCTPLQVAFSGASRSATTSGVLFACTCGAPLWVTADLAGRQGRCRFCKRLIQIPRASVVPPAQMSTKTAPKPATSSKDVAKDVAKHAAKDAAKDVAKDVAKDAAKDATPAARPDAHDSATPASRRPAAPTPKPVAPTPIPAAPPSDLIRLDEEHDIVDIDSRPANEAAAGHRTYTGFTLPPDAASISPPSTTPEPPTRRPFPTPKPREASADLSIDERIDIPTGVAAGGSPVSPSPRIPRPAAPVKPPSVKPPATRPIASATTKPVPKPPAPAASSATSADKSQAPVAPPKPPAAPVPASPVPVGSNAPPPDTTVWDSDPPAAAPADPSSNNGPEFVDFDSPHTDAITISSPKLAHELDAFSSLSLNANDAVMSSSATADRPTGLLTSGVATNTADTVPPSHMTEPPQFPAAPEPPAATGSQPVRVSEIEPPAVSQVELPAMSEVEPPVVSEVEPATLAEAVFGGESADPTPHNPELNPVIEPHLFDADDAEMAAVSATSDSPAPADTAPADTAPADTAPDRKMNQLQSTTPDSHEAGPTQAVPMSAQPTPSRPAPTSAHVVLVCASIVSWLPGAFTFGVPSFIAAAFAISFLMRRDTRRPTVFIAAIVALLGGLIGIAVSAAWWLSKPIFHWKAW